MLDKLRKLREQRAEGDNGFTLIELLVVVVIIGILIAIAIPLYLNYEKGAKDRSAASDLRNAISVLEQCNADNAGYPTGLGTISGNTYNALVGCGTAGSEQINLSSGTVMKYTPTGTVSYVVIADNTGGSGKLYCYDSAAGGSVATVANTGTTSAPVGTC